MKKALAMVAVFALALPLVLGACGKKDEDKSPTTTAKQETTTASETTTADNGGQAQDQALWDELVGVVNNLMERVNQLNYIDSCALQTDPSISYTDENGFTYYLVTDPNFQNIGDIMIYLSDTFTIAGASYHYPYLFDMSSTTPPPYIFVQEDSLPKGLYSLPAGKGSAVYKITSEIEFTDYTDDHFVATFDAQVIGATERIRLSVSKEDNMWKISALDILE